MDQLWANRAASAEAAIAKRHLKKLWGLPGTQLGVVAWPAARKYRMFGTWHYWWQAHLLDCLVDAQLRDPQPERVQKIARQIRGHRLRNNLRWTNDYYDDMAWLAHRPRTGRAARRRRAAEGAGQAVRAVPQRMGARGRRRHPVAQAGPVLQCPGERPGGDLPGAPRPAAPGPADVGLARRNADRPRDPSGVRRDQGRLDGAGAVHLLSGRGARPGNRTRGAHRGRRPRQAGASPRRRGARQHGTRGHHQGRGRRRRRSVQRDPCALPGAGGHLVCRRTTPTTPRPATPPASWC